MITDEVRRMEEEGEDWTGSRNPRPLDPGDRGGESRRVHWGWPHTKARSHEGRGFHRRGANHQFSQEIIVRNACLQYHGFGWSSVPWRMDRFGYWIFQTYHRNRTEPQSSCCPICLKNTVLDAQYTFL